VNSIVASPIDTDKALGELRLAAEVLSGQVGIDPHPHA
jgi:hypothetical protein